MPRRRTILVKMVDNCFVVRRVMYDNLMTAILSASVIAREEGVSVVIDESCISDLHEMCLSALVAGIPQS